MTQWVGKTHFIRGNGKKNKRKQVTPPCLSDLLFGEVSSIQIAFTSLRLFPNGGDITWIEMQSNTASVITAESESVAYWFGFAQNLKNTEITIKILEAAMRKTHCCRKELRCYVRPTSDQTLQLLTLRRKRKMNHIARKFSPGERTVNSSDKQPVERIRKRQGIQIKSFDSGGWAQNPKQEW